MTQVLLYVACWLAAVLLMVSVVKLTGLSDDAAFVLGLLGGGTSVGVAYLLWSEP